MRFPEADRLVLGHGFWQRELGARADVVGSTVTLSDVPYTVAGVTPAEFDVRLLDRPEGAAFWTLIRPGDRGYEPGGMWPVTIIVGWPMARRSTRPAPKRRP